MNIEIQLPNHLPLFKVKRTDVWNLARFAMREIAQGDMTNYGLAMSRLLHAACFISELALINAGTNDEIGLVQECIRLNKLDFNVLADAIAEEAAKKRAQAK